MVIWNVTCEMGVAYLQVSSRPVLEGLEKTTESVHGFRAGLWNDDLLIMPQKTGCHLFHLTFGFFLRAFYFSFCLTGRRPVDTEATLYCVLRSVMKCRAGVPLNLAVRIDSVSRICLDSQHFEHHNGELSLSRLLSLSLSFCVSSYPFTALRKFKIPSSGIITLLSLFKSSSALLLSLDEILINKWVQFTLPK